MTYYDLEIIDLSDSVENFKFQKLSKSDIDNVVKNFKEDKNTIEFEALEGHIILKTSQIRGLMYQDYEEREKTILEENADAAKEVVSKIKLKKRVTVGLPKGDNK